MTPLAMARFSAPFDWDAIDATIAEAGGAILEGFVSSEVVDRLNSEIDAFLETGMHGLPETGSDGYDQFLGHNTVRLHGLIPKFPTVIDLVGNAAVLDWVDRTLGPMASSQLMNAAELIQIGPGEPSQFFHRDSDSWPHMHRGEDPIIVNAIVALTPFTKRNGATNVFPGSHRWTSERRGHMADAIQAEMSQGDALFFRGDVLHGGGANATSDEHRRGISLSYCVGWLRTVENSFLNVPRDMVSTLPVRLQRSLGYQSHNGMESNGGLLGLYENGDPSRAL